MFFELATLALNVVGGIRQKKAGDEAAAAHRAVGEFNAQMEERTVDQYAGAGIVVGSGTPMRLARQFAREFEVDQAKQDFNVANRIMQMEDAKEDARLRAKLSRMEGGYQAAAAKSAGTASMIQSFGQAARFGYENRNVFRIG